MRSLQIFILALCVMVLEVALTRIFSFIMFHHLTYLVISVALLGFGAAGAYLTTRPPLDEVAAREFVPRHAFLFGLSAVGAVVFIPRVQFYLEDMYRLGDYSNLLSLLLMILFAGTPFFFAGAGIGFLISRAGEDVNRVYFSDLSGAALGSLLAIVSISTLGGTASCLAVGAMAFLVAAISGTRHRPTRLVLFALTALFAGVVARTEWLTLYAPPDKPLFRRNGEVERIQWHPIARIDVTIPFERHHSFGGALAPNYQGPPPLTRLVFQDGGALTGIIQPQGTPQHTSVFGQYMQGASYVVKKNARALVIGCGGGVDIEIALHHGALHVVGVDVNPKIVELLRTTYADFARGVFQRDDVELVVSEGRHFLTRDDRKFDVIQMSGVDTYTALAAGAYALTENFIYTREALDQYLAHLEPDGIVSITRPLIRPPRETLKLAVTAVEAVAALGVEHPEEHIVILSGRGQGSFFGVPWGQTMIKRSPFTRSEVETLTAWAEARQFRVAFAPFGQGRGRLARYLRGSPIERAFMLAEDPREIVPATDDRPFFFHFYPWRKLWTFHWLRGEDPPLSVAAILVLATLVQVVLLSGLLILYPLLRHRLPSGPGGKAGIFVYFASLGLGFILIEIALLQKFTIFLGGPTYSMSVTLFSVLLSSGIGSLVSKRLTRNPLTLISITVPVLAALTVVASLVFDSLTAGMLGLPRAGRIVAVVLMVMPLGFLMGMPFPSGLLLVNRKRPELNPWAWGINACMTVAGTVLAVILSTAVGFNRAMQVGAAVYVLGWLVFRTSQRGVARPAG